MKTCKTGTMALVGLGGAAAGALAYSAYKKSQEEAAVSGLGVILRAPIAPITTLRSPTTTRFGEYDFEDISLRQVAIWGDRLVAPILDSRVIGFLNFRTLPPDVLERFRINKVIWKYYIGPKTNYVYIKATAPTFTKYGVLTLQGSMRPITFAELKSRE